MKTLPASCGYQGYEFGASYPDSQCFGGRLYDMDNCDNSGNLYEPMDYIPCPMCHPRLAVKYHAEMAALSDRKKDRGVAMRNARALVSDIRNNRKNGTEPWKEARNA